MTVAELRSKYLKFFEKRGHVILPSSPLVPENDPTTLFTSAGMQPMITYLLGQSHPKGTRLVDSQKCFRTQDIEEVGDNRHTTCFEMLGNWSLGDYFKKEQIEWLFTFLTDKEEGLGIDPQKLFVTVFRGQADIQVPKDDEAVSLWQGQFAKLGIEAKDIDFSERDGMQAGRIFYYEAKKNWWSRVGVPENMPVGEPGGPDSEVFYDFGAELQIHEKSAFKDLPCHVNCDCGRFIEIGNSVFMTYVKTAQGFEPLEKKNIDFGGGLERVLAAVQDEQDMFKTDAFASIIEEIEKTVQQTYGGENTAEMRVIADHIKASVFLIKDGVRPSNKTQGYFLRRLIRRATVKLHKLGGGLDSANLFTIADRGVLQEYDGVYFDRKNDRDLVESILTEEAEKFAKSLDKGLREFEKQAEIDGKFAFDLYQTYGFPLEITVELAQQKGQQFDVARFTEEFDKHKTLSRTASAGMFKGGLADHSEITTKYHTTTHLLQAALRKVLGKHVQQKGSNITAERMRFDFSHPASMTPEQIQQVQDQMNEWIKADLPVTVQTMQKQAALESGAIAFFIEKYPDQVTVYTIGKDPETDWISKELCGGPHVKSTGEIGEIELFKEQSASAGVRRIYAKVK